jgi:HD-GYP domain-containing protein (c-di-GMP phosphodiesterase class II)/putative methionine-R-sulfoxide reductase with GAF domain
MARVRAHSSGSGSLSEVVELRGRRSIEQMQLLQSLSGALARARSEREVGHAVVSELEKIIDYHSCRFYLVSENGQQLLPVAYHGSEPTYASDRYDALIVDVGEGITGRVFVEGEARLVDDAGALPYAVKVPGTPDIDESMVVAPMRSESGPVGVIVLSKRGRRQFDGDDLRLLEVIAAQAAVACDNARLYGRLHDSAEVSEALLDLGGALAAQSTIEGIATMLALAADRLVESAAISVWLRDGRRLRVAASVGYAPPERERLDAAPIDLDRSLRLARALARRRVTVAEAAELPAIAGALDDPPPDTTFALVAVGERAANRGLIAVQRDGRTGPPTLRDERMLLGIADQALPAITNRVLFEELERSFLATVKALANALEMKDQYTNDHAQALIGLSTAVTRRMGASDDYVRDVRFAAALHDVGKIGIPADILQKAGPLTDDEFEVMKQHPALGARIIEPVTALAGARDLVAACHEHYDGRGYPRGLARDQIPLGARIILVCDAFHAMTSDRVYRPAMTAAEALDELRRHAGSQFDPAVVEALAAEVAGLEVAAAS